LIKAFLEIDPPTFASKEIWKNCFVCPHPT
jgi:hypothetical protein